MLLWSALSFLPDADVVGFRFGVAYGDEWGHRGATHAPAFAVLVGVAIAVISPRLRLPPLRTGLLATLVVASHGLLDTLTDGGLGCALLWPFSDERFFAPWQPLPVAPIGGAFFSPSGLRVALVELAWFAPLLAYALLPRSLAHRLWRPGASDNAQQ
jgi:inner membrane protein